MAGQKYRKIMTFRFFMNSSDEINPAGVVETQRLLGEL